MTAASRHFCSLNVGVHCTRGNGKPRRKRCGWCGGSLVTQAGAWGVFVWRSDAHYALADARSTHRTETAARRAALADPALVWRFIAS